MDYNLFKSDTEFDPKKERRCKVPKSCHVVPNFKTGVCEGTPDQMLVDPYDNQRKHFIVLPLIHAIIVSPALGSPLIAEPGAPLTVHLLINEELKDEFYVKEMPEYMKKVVSPFINEDPRNFFKQRVCKQLRFNEWSNRKEQKIHFKNPYYTSKSILDYNNVAELEPIQTTIPELISPNAKCLYLRDLSGNIIGNVRDSVFQFYVKHGFKYLINVTLPQHRLTKAGLYNLAWLSADKSRDDFLDDYPLGRFYEPQDELMQQFFYEFGSKLNKQFVIPETGDLTFALDEEDPICSYHPVYVVDKPKLNIGHLSDVHVCSRQELFKKSKLQVVPGLSPEISPHIGSRVLSCFDSFKDLLEQMGEQADVVVITGDLVDYSSNLYQPQIDEELDALPEEKYDTKIWKYGKLAKLLDSEPYAKLYYTKKWAESKFNKKLYKRYKYFDESKTLRNYDGKKPKLHYYYIPGMDAMLVYSLLIYFYDKYQKPVFIVSGNHDFYSKPFGISPRMAGESIKCNEGIPLDHNLGFYEAILMYGRGYNDYVKAFNFTKRRGDLFYSLFTGLTDYSFTYKSQTFNLLEWGDNEEFMKNKFFLKGLLPRATTTLNDLQSEILSNAAVRHFNKNNGVNGDIMLFTHATVINYDSKFSTREAGHIYLTDPKIIKTGKEVELLDLEKTMNPIEYERFKFNYLYRLYDTGSTKDCGNKYTFFRERIFMPELTHCFSGHSHRAALYRCDDIFKMKYTTNLYVVKTGAVDVSHGRKMDLSNYYSLRNSKSTTRILVTGSGGPISTTNINGELGNMGLDVPNGLLLTYEGEKDFLQNIKCRHPKARPRFAALLDGFDILQDDRVFTEFARVRGQLYQIKVNNKFYVHVSGAKVYPNFIKGISLVAADKKEKTEFIDIWTNPMKELFFKEYESYAYTMILNIEDYLKKIEEHNFLYVIIHLNQFSNTYSVLDKYCFKDPWIYKATHKGRSLERDSSLGEVPNFREYKELHIAKNFSDKVISSKK